MSHYTVTVRVSAERLKKHNNDVGEAVDEMLYPFYEQPDAGDPRLEFESAEEEIRGDYDKGKVKRWRTPLGEPVVLGQWEDPAKEGETGYEPGWTLDAEVSLSEAFPDFNAWRKERADDYGYKEHKGEFGYWRNPNAKWDWYVSGGRWRGFYPVKGKASVGESGVFDNAAKPGHGDIVRVSDIDMDKVAAKHKADEDEFFAQYERMLAGEKVDDWDGPRSRAMRMGLVEVVQEKVAAKDGHVCLAWSRHAHITGERAAWTDVCKVITREQLTAGYGVHFNPLVTFAALDNDGWHEPGEMGWFACSSDTPESLKAFREGFVEKFIKAAGPDDLLVVVDCHI